MAEAAELKDNSTVMENEQSATTSGISNTTTTSPRTRPPPISIYSSGERHTVQVIQQAMHRPASSAAQYLQQMYAAQQQHLMLHTAALQQQHMGSTQVQSLAAVQQASLSGGRQSSSPTVSVTQQASMSQTSVNVSTSPTPAQLISRSHASSTTSSSITQQTMLLGGTSPNRTSSQAQMYLQAQMLIFTPAATVTAVHSDIPIVSSSSPSPCQSMAAQNVTLHSQQLGLLTDSQKSPSKISARTHPLSISYTPTITSSRVIQSDRSLEMNRKRQSPSPESRCTTVTHTSSLHQLIPTASFTPVEPNPLIKHQQNPLNSPFPRGPHHQLVLQQDQQQKHQQHHQHIHLMEQQQIHTTTIESPPPDAPWSQYCVPLCSRTQAPVSGSIASLQCSSVQTRASSLTTSPTLSSQQSVVVSPPPTHSPSQSPSIIMHPQVPSQSQPQCFLPSSMQSVQNAQQFTGNEVQPTQQLNFSSHLPTPQFSAAHIGPMQQANVISPREQIVTPSEQQNSVLQLTPSLTSTPAEMSMTPPDNVQTVPPKSMQAEALHPEMLSSHHILLPSALISEEELPAAEALAQLPFQDIPQPQTVAVNLQVLPAAAFETPVVHQANEACEEEIPALTEEYVHILRTPTPPTLSPQCICTGNEEELTLEDTLPGFLKEISTVSASVIKSPSDPSYASIPPPPILLPAATRNNCTLMSNRIPSTEKNPPQAIVKPQILTHVIEGFVIQEGLEPFPVNRSSLLVEQHEKARVLVKDQIMSVTCVQSKQQNSVKHTEISTDTDMEDTIAEEGLEEMETELLTCEFCGKMGCANQFLRSKRFCSMSCAKRCNVNCTKRVGLFKSNKSSHWSRIPKSSLSRCGRQSSGSEGVVREHFLRQLPITFPPTGDALLASQDSIPTAKTAHLRRHSKREQKLREQRINKIPERVDLLPRAQRDPSLWTIQEVWVFIHSLPGCQDIADEFRMQEIDGQALLLLKEDHLMSAMNIKLGPALKICAQINLLKES